MIIMMMAFVVPTTLWAPSRSTNYSLNRRV